MPFKPDTAATPRFRPDTPEAPLEIPQRRLPSISTAGDRATGFREQVEATGMTPEERQAAVAGTIPIVASLAAGPVAGGLIRSTAPFIAGRFAPTLARFGESIQSGGLAPGLSIPQRVFGAGTSGAISTAIINPEDVVTGATISALTPGVAKVGRALMPSVAPTTKELTKAADKEYNAMRALNESLSPASFNTLQTSLVNAANSAQYLPSKHTRLANAFQIFKEQAKLNQPVSIDRVDKLRKELARAANSPDKEERDLAQALVQQLDAFVSNAAPASAAHLAVGRDLVTRKSRSKVIDDIMYKAAKSKSGDKASIIQNEFRNISAGASKADAAKKRQFTNDEQAIIADIGEGRLDISALRGAGNLLAPTTLNRNLMLNLPGYGFLASQFGPTIGAGTAVAGYVGGLGSRALANRLAMMRADQLRAAAATGGAAAQRFAPTIFPQFAPVAATNAMAPEQVDFMREQERINALGF